MNLINTLIYNFSDVMLNTVRIFSSVFEIMLSFLLINSFFKSRIKSKNVDFLPFVVLAGIMIVIGEIFSPPLALKYSAECVLLIALLFVFYQGDIKMKMIASGLFITMIVLSVSAGSLVFNLMSRRISFGEGSFTTLLRLSFYNLFMIIFSILISVSGKKSPLYTAEAPLRMGLLIVPVITMVTFAVFQYYIDISPPDDRIVVYIYISGAGLIFINILVFVLFGRLRSQLEMKRENDILTSQLSLQEASIINLENSYNRTRAFRHDIKNHILLMNMLAEQGKIDELRSYLKDMSGVIDESSYVRISGISAVDAILNEKLYEAQSKTITTSYDVINLDKNRISPIDLCIILSNALDNAIEANEKIENPDDRYIKLKIHGNETFSVISVSNPTTQELTKVNGIIKTSKKDSENHGFGLKSIDTAVKNYNGEMLCKSDDGVFTIVIRLTAPTV